MSGTHVRTFNGVRITTTIGSSENHIKRKPTPTVKVSPKTETPSQSGINDVEFSSESTSDINNWLKEYAPNNNNIEILSPPDEFGVMEGVDNRMYIKINGKTVIYTPIASCFKKGSIGEGINKLEIVNLRGKWYVNNLKKGNKTPYVYAKLTTPNIKIVKKPTITKLSPDDARRRAESYSPPEIGAYIETEVKAITKDSSLKSAMSEISSSNFKKSDNEKVLSSDSHYLFMGLSSLEESKIKLNYESGTKETSYFAGEIKQSLSRIKDNCLIIEEKLNNTSGRMEIQSYIKKSFPGLSDGEVTRMMTTIEYEALTMLNRINFHLDNGGENIISFSAKSEDHREEGGTMAFVFSGDESNNIYMNLDEMAAGDPVVTSRKLDETITHESTHQTSTTLDISYISSEENGHAQNLKDAIEEYKEDIVGDDFDHKEEFIQTVFGMSENTHIDEKDIDSIFNLAVSSYKKNTNKLIPTLILRNADTEAIMFRDLAAGHSPDYNIRGVRDISIESNVDKHHKLDSALMRALLVSKSKG